MRSAIYCLNTLFLKRTNSTADAVNRERKGFRDFEAIYLGATKRA